MKLLQRTDTLLLDHLTSALVSVAIVIHLNITMITELGIQKFRYVGRSFAFRVDL